MSDLFRGQTMTEMKSFISAGTAHTFTLGNQYDKVVFRNLTQSAAVAGNIPESIFYRGLTTTDYAYQEVVIDSAAAESFNYKIIAADGFTVADTDGGVDSRHATISAITKADPCVITHSAYTFQDGQQVRITDLGPEMPTARGMNQLNNNLYSITVLTSTTFSLQDVITGEDIDSTAFVTYVEGGRITLVTNVSRINNPESASYTGNPYAYEEIEYKLTAGTGIMGSDGDQFVIECYKFGSVEDLGDLLT